MGSAEIGVLRTQPTETGESEMPGGGLDSPDFRLESSLNQKGPTAPRFHKVYLPMKSGLRFSINARMPSF